MQMEQLKKALLLVAWHKKKVEEIPVKYNPTEFSLDKSVQLAEVTIPGLDAPLQQFVRGQAEKLTVDLFFDTTEDGMGPDATSVTTWTDRIYQLVKIEPTRHAPPVCTFVWNDQFPGSLLRSSTEGDRDPFGNQRRNGFQCVVESVRQKFTLFSPEGVPLRATLTLTLREYKTLDEQLQHLNLTSPDRTHSHVVRRGETLSSIADRYYDRSNEWRHIADDNAIEDPRRLEVGTFLSIPPVR
jgi:nucleoid-associated protein YgaU